MFARIPKPLSILLALVFLAFAPWASAARLEILEGENYDLIASTSRGLRLRFREPDLVFRVGGRLHGDAAFFDADRSDPDDDAKLRRARVYLSGRILDDFGFKIERELAPSKGEFRNLWASYRASSRLAFKVGNFIAPFGLEQISSSNYLTFMERSMSGSIAPSFTTGARIDGNWRLTDRRTRHRMAWSLAAGIEPLGQASDDQHRSEHWSVVSRLSYAPIARKRQVVHFGGAAEFRDVLGDSPYRISTQVESSLGPRIIDTGDIGGVDSTVALGAEAAALFGPVLIQSEYHHAFLQRDAGAGDLEFGGGYVQASWVVTGERRQYSPRVGVFQGVNPRSDWGAVELAARYSVMDLRDGDVNGGEATAWTAGLNWYIWSNLRFMFNYVYVDAEQRNTGASDQPHIFQFRAQLHF